MSALVPEKYLHDFDKIDHSNCEYKREKAWNIDVDKILSGVGDVDDQFLSAVSDVASSFEGSSATLDDLKKKPESTRCGPASPPQERSPLQRFPAASGCNDRP